MSILVNPETSSGFRGLSKMQTGMSLSCRRISNIIISLSLAASIALSGCEIEFTPAVAPLEIEEAPDQPFTDEIIPQDAESGELIQEGAPDAEPISEFTSSAALALCGVGLSWGDQAIGMCLAPGGESYFAWTDESNVIRVNADATDINQSIFQQAAGDRSSAVEEIDRQRRSMLFEGIAFGIALVAFIPACATVVGCAVDGAALLVSGGLLAESGSSIVTNIEAGESAVKRADYAYCRMIGGSDTDCRVKAGVTNELGEK